MKYLIIGTIIIFCCGFTICDRIVKKRTGWEMYIYPDCSDSTTYIKQIYDKRDPYKEKNRKGKWVPYKGEYSIEEQLYVHGTVRRESNYYVHHDANFFSDNIRYDEKVEEIYSTKYPPESRTLYIGKSMTFDISYNNDGTFSSCTVEDISKNGHNEGMEIVWSKMYETKWIGFYKMVPAFRIDSVNRMDDSTGSATTMIIKRDSLVKIGNWKKYNSKNEIIDSAYYK